MRGVRYESVVACSGCSIVSIANDTDIIVLGISLFSYISADKLWVSFGVGNKLRNISIHDICSTMSSTNEESLPAS